MLDKSFSLAYTLYYENEKKTDWMIISDRRIFPNVVNDEAGSGSCGNHAPIRSHRAADNRVCPAGSQWRAGGNHVQHQLFK
jgi:hypothetical protein